MSIGRAHAVALLGLDGAIVEIEADVASGLPWFGLVGLADAALGEAKARVRSALVNAGVHFPDGRVTVNLSPASLPKHGSGFDLGIAAALLVAGRIVPGESVATRLPPGRARARRAASAVSRRAAGGARGGPGRVPTRSWCPRATPAEAALVPGIRVVGLASLREVAIWHGAELEPVEVEAIAAPAGPVATPGEAGDLSDVVGSPDAVEAVQVAAAGGHHVFLLGPPGAGKTMLAARLPGLLPDLDPEAALEVSSIRSLAGLPVGGGLSIPSAAGGAAPHRESDGDHRRRIGRHPAGRGRPGPRTACCSSTRRRSSRRPRSTRCASRSSPASSRSRGRPRRRGSRRGSNSCSPPTRAHAGMPAFATATARCTPFTRRALPRAAERSAARPDRHPARRAAGVCRPTADGRARPRHRPRSRTGRRRAVGRGRTSCRDPVAAQRPRAGHLAPIAASAPRIAVPRPRSTVRWNAARSPCAATTACCGSRGRWPTSTGSRAPAPTRSVGRSTCGRQRHDDPRYRGDDRDVVDATPDRSVPGSRRARGSIRPGDLDAASPSRAIARRAGWSPSSAPRPPWRCCWIVATGPRSPMRCRAGSAADAEPDDREEFEAAVARWVPRLSRETALRALTQAARFGVKLMCPDDPEWPRRVRRSRRPRPDRDLVRGRRESLSTLARSIALVGARAATGYGEHVTIDVAAGLVDRGFTIVSGAAYGIDGAAHRAALASRGTTIAFLAGGLDRFYPSGHEALLTRIMEPAPSCPRSRAARRRRNGASSSATGSSPRRARPPS